MTSGAVGTLHGFTVDSGDPSASTAVGYFAVTVTSGTFQASESLRNQATTDVFATSGTQHGNVSTMWKSTLDGWELVDPSDLRSVVSASGKVMEFTVYNFGGHSGTRSLYGVDGVNKAFEWDGTTFTEITTGMTTDAPTHIAARRKTLYLSFSGGSVQHSAIGDPTNFTPVVTAAAELGVGDEVTGMLVVRDDALMIASKDSIKFLTGAPSASDVLLDYSNDLGSIEWSLQNVGVPMFLDQEGLVLLAASDVSGGWNRDTASQKINKSLLPKRTIVTASVVRRSTNVYRLFFSDGSGYSVSLNGNFSAGIGAVTGISKLSFQHAVTTACNSNDAASAETIHFASSADGYIRRMDSGTSMDGTAFFYQLKTAYDYMPSHKDAYTRATFRTVRLQMDAKSLNTQLTVRPSFDWGLPGKADPIAISFSPSGRLGFTLGSATDGILGEDTLGGTSTPIATFYAGQQGGVSMSLYIYGKTSDEKPHTFYGVLTEWDAEGREQSH